MVYILVLMELSGNGAHFTSPDDDTLLASPKPVRLYLSRAEWEREGRPSTLRVEIGAPRA